MQSILGTKWQQSKDWKLRSMRSLLFLISPEMLAVEKPWKYNEKYEMKMNKYIYCVDCKRNFAM